MGRETRISKYVSMKEAIKSQTAIRRGIDNYPDNEQHLKAMKHVASTIFDPVREHFGVPIGISSFYRSPKLNTAIKGSKDSQHCIGEAIDIDADMFGRITNMQIFDYIKDNFEFHQLIHEFGDDTEPAWVHVGLRRNGNNRNEILRAYLVWDDKKKKNKTVYKKWDGSAWVDR